MPYNYYPNNQYYMQNLQDLRDRVDAQMKQYQQSQMQQPQVPTNLTQNFQLAPNPTNNELESKYANSIDEVKNTFVMKTGIFVNKDYSVMWIKNTDGSIRTFDLTERIELDPRDKEIQMLRNEIERMKGMISNESNVNNSNTNGEYESKNATKLSNRKQSNAK